MSTQIKYVSFKKVIMEPINKIFKAFFVALILFSNKGLAQNYKIKNVISYVFNNDSLSGFDEEAAKLATLSEGFLGDEFKVHMFQLKRQYINNKFNISTYKKYSFLTSQKNTVVSPACTNEDFEGSAAGIITLPNQINGWTVSGGTNFLPNNSCNLGGCCPSSPSESELIFCPPATGYIDPVIGGCYPIYSVFGTTPNNGNSVNPSLPSMGGDKVIRINDETQDFSIEKLSKTFPVTANNALFQFAFISVFFPGHPCCDAGAFQIKLINASTNQVLACPNFSISAPSSQCASTNTSVNYFIGGSACISNTPSNTQPIFNKWNFNSLDLSAYIGQNLTIEVIASDCTGGAHYGCVYFDSQCSPMTIIGNGTGFPAGTPNIILPTCGASGATITAPTGLGPYSWNSSQISIPSNLTVPSSTNITLITNQSGTVQLTMNPPGSCAPITKVITVTITPSPVAVISATQPGCTNSLSAASLTTAGSASVNPTITWNPAPSSLTSNSLNATGLAIGITTVTVQDVTGCQVATTVNILSSPPAITFSVINTTGSASITCKYPTINMNAVTNYTNGSLTYTWTSSSFSATGTSVNLTQAGSYTVCARDASSGCLACNVFTLGQNTTPPTFTVNPVSQAITCSNSFVTFTSTANSPTNNIFFSWYSPAVSYPSGTPSFTSMGAVSLFSSAIPGVYHVVDSNIVNGCVSTKTLELTSLEAFPTFSVVSSTNFSLGCSPGTTTLSVTNASTTGAINYAFAPPGFTGTVYPFNGFPTITTSIPGLWIVAVKDINNGCVSAIPITVFQNTVGPHVNVSLNTQTLTCFNPTILATATSSTSGTQITWNVPGSVTGLSTASVIIGPPTGPPTNPNSLSYPSYTAVVTNTVSGCITKSVIPIYQNFKAPTPLLQAAGSPSVINCGGTPVTISFTNNAINSGIIGAVANVLSWVGPSPQASVAATPAYSAYIAGIYTINVQDSKNGCIGSATLNILDKTQPPVLVNSVATSTLDCGANTATLNMQVVGGNNGMKFWFTEYPKTTPPPAFSPSNAIVYPGTSNSTVLVTVLGHYEYLVTNTLTGCKTTGTFEVLPGKLAVDFTPDVTTGFAPLTVMFTNNSSSSLGSGGINSLWSYGNGSTQTTSGNVSTSTIFNAPGTYTVWLIASKGSCVDSTSRVVNVEIPSKLETPNVFTPNGDGSNDVFFLKVANLTEINAFIFDRWGNKVYETTSTTGNIAWDGKNLSNKECPSGTYFYIIKANGKDGKAYEQRGNVSLFR